MKLPVGGQWVETESVIEVRNPFNGTLIETVPKASAALAGEAIDFAATYDYRLTAWERFEILRKVHDLVLGDAKSLGRLISEESGKTLKDSHKEILRSAQTFLLSAEEAKRINGEVLPIDSVANVGKGMAFVIREPVGVIVSIAPFNYPFNLVAHKVGPAIAANNPVVVKPASSTPLSAIKMAEYFFEAGLPHEMLQVITGDSSEVGDPLITHPLTRKITFTGSVAVGKAISSKAILQAVSMELGGNDPLVILADADLDKVIPAAVDGAFGNNGERCTSVKRVIVEEGIADDFTELFVKASKKLKLGDQLAPGTDIGPLINEAAAEEIQGRVKRAVAAGARLLCGGTRQGTLFPATILDRVDPSCELVQEETFGPVAPIMRVPDFESAIAMANDTPFGLQSGIFTNDMDKAFEAARRLQMGAVMFNRAPGFRAEHLPFGGVKDSGVGREGVKYAVEAMTVLKTIVI